MLVILFTPFYTLATTGESQQPQQNGRAEALVRVIKNRVKVLLRTASLPMSCWPLAAEFSARRQRDLALGDRTDEGLPFGAPMHIKHKRFGGGGKYDLAERGRSGTFVGYSGDVRGGRVVRHGDGSYTTSVHIKPYLVDSDELVEHGPFEMEVENPVRTSWTTSATAHMMLWNYGSFGMTQGSGLQMLVGQYTHGGQCGVALDSDRFPFATSYLVKAFNEITGESDFTSILVTEDAGMQIHRDVPNHGGRDNILLPLLPCEQGGGVWIESDPADFDVKDEWRQLPRGDWRRGKVYHLKTGEPIHINPRKFHQTEEWQGRTAGVRLRPTSSIPPQVPEPLQQVMLKMMDLQETRNPPDAVMFQVSGNPEERREKSIEISQELQQLQEDVLGRLQERREWLQDFLAEEEILAEDVDDQVKEVESRCHDLYLKVANVTDDQKIGDVEDYLINLKRDLDVTLDVPLDQVKANLEDWIEPMSKELSNLEAKTNAIEPRPMAEARKLVSEGSLILIPGKVVFMVKPPAPETKAEKKSKGPRWKRKARIVICGNMASQSLNGQDLYAAGASVEALRLALALASGLGWIAAATDANLVPENVVFVVKRARYGLRESPALWANHRTKVLKEIVVHCPEGCLWLRPLITDGELWLILFLPTGAQRPQLKGLLVTYVDDLLYLAKRAIILLLHGKISSIWPWSDLEFSDKGLRYLGMELRTRSLWDKRAMSPYVTNLVRLHGLDPDDKAALPCPREWIQDDEQEAETQNFSAEELTRAQRSTNYMAAMTAKKPVKVYNVGLKVIAYLNSTMNLKLNVEATAEPTQSPAEPTQSPVEPMQSPAEPTQSPAEPTQSPAEPTQNRPHEAMLEEVLPGCKVPTLYIDNMAASNILNGPAGGPSYEDAQQSEADALKVIWKWMGSLLFESKTAKKLKKLRELARIAVGTEIEKWAEADISEEATVEQTINEADGSLRDYKAPYASYPSGPFTFTYQAIKPHPRGHDGVGYQIRLDPEAGTKDGMRDALARRDKSKEDLNDPQVGISGLLQELLSKTAENFQASESRRLEAEGVAHELKQRVVQLEAQLKSRSDRPEASPGEPMEPDVDRVSLVRNAPTLPNTPLLETRKVLDARRISSHSALASQVQHDSMCDDCRSGNFQSRSLLLTAA
ncbi:GIP [Symbiodinium sp. CCMP2592]|nr:GIP [Symbiodinium sp. CCMP2592]